MRELAGAILRVMCLESCFGVFFGCEVSGSACRSKVLLLVFCSCVRVGVCCVG